MAVRRGLVVVVDDDAGVREALGSLIRSEGWTVEGFATADAFLESGTSARADCLILDIHLPGMSGLELQARLVEIGSQTPIVFLSGVADVPMSVKAMKAGAVEFLTKPFTDDELLEGIERATEQSRALRVLQECYAALTARERTVMDHVVAGKPNKQIADDLGVAEGTIKVHRGQVMRKMQAKSLADLVRMADKLRMRSSHTPSRRD